MRILDRYIISAFLKNYLISFMVLVGMYVVLDMLFKFDELMEVDRAGRNGLQSLLAMAGNVVDYYGYQIALYFVYLSGVIPIVAAAFTLIRVSRFNEMSAMLSAGVPLLRVAAPMIFVALILNSLLLIDQEVLIPRIIPKLVRKPGEVLEKEKNAFTVAIMQDSKKSLLMARRAYPTAQPPTMVGVSIIRTEDGRPLGLVTAEKAEWDGQAWRLTAGQEVSGLKPVSDDEAVPAVTTEPCARWETSIDPETLQLYGTSEFVTLLSTQRINQLLMHPETYGRSDLLRTKHTRFMQPLVNIILLLLAIACVLTRDPQSLKMAATRCVMLCGLCLAAQFATFYFAGQPPSSNWADRWPAMMAWMPVLTFGPLSLWLLDRVRT